ncbi:MAG TPA: methyltransferase domain-containing protein [Pyrinomonadaceae bacterium]|jgi:2-polyprenyl-3-methyl-5-hydroxy-6-metoxy-1,4-benzoquinol methylase/glycosyltransferase involved in cell wall biosynthesis
MKLAYFSPFNPQQSGIADYSEELLPYLAEGAEIDLFVEGFQPANKEIRTRFRCFDYLRDPSALARLEDGYDAVLYHIGNDHRYHAGIYDVARQHRGIIVFHDFALQTFFIGLARARRDMNIYLDEVEACHGGRARAEAAEAFARGTLPWYAETPLAFPLNARLARAAEAIIVHSEWSRERLAQVVPATPIARINHHITARAAAEATATPLTTRDESNTRAGRNAAVQIASFGLITPDKGIERALRALAALAPDHDFHYTLVGAPNQFFDVRERISHYGLDDRVSITGYVSLPEFERRISEADIAVNIRERTNGETSGSLCRIMAAAVPAIVSNVGWFSELPADAVIKIDMDEYGDALLHAYLKRLIEDAPLRRALGANARRHVLAEHTIEQSAAGYLAFIREVADGRVRRRFVGGVSTEAALLGIDARQDDALLRTVAVEVATLAPAHAFTHDRPSHNNNGTNMTNSNTDPHANDSRNDADAGTPSASSSSDSNVSSANSTASSADSNGRLPKIEGIDYARAAIEYPRKLDAERHHYLLTKPFYNLANKPPKHTGDGMDAETHRHFCDFANMAVALALPAGGRLLDVGCGSGWLCEYFARLGYDATGIDISPDLIEMAEDRLRRITYSVDHRTPLRYRFQTHDIETAPLDETFDAVVCYDSLHHFVDERAVIRHLAAMLPVGGLLFVLEGDRPPTGSPTEQELIGVMEEYETLESPFSPVYLRSLLDEHGFAVVGDFVSINGLFERELLKTADDDDAEGESYLPVRPEAVNYLLCKKVAEGAPAASVPDSRAPSVLRANLALLEPWTERVAAGSEIRVRVEITNTGDTLWLTGPATRRGAVMPAVKLFDADGNKLRERHGVPPLARVVAPGESVRITIEEHAPDAAGEYQLKIDMVAQHVAWFEQRGSEPLTLRFVVG